VLANPLKTLLRIFSSLAWSRNENKSKITGELSWKFLVCVGASSSFCSEILFFPASTSMNLLELLSGQFNRNFMLDVNFLIKNFFESRNDFSILKDLKLWPNQSQRKAEINHTWCDLLN
jgi:hypothetical protein